MLIHNDASQKHRLNSNRTIHNCWRGHEKSISTTNSRVVLCSTAQGMATRCTVLVCIVGLQWGSAAVCPTPPWSPTHPPPACAIAEAAYLNRTLLFSDQFCQPNNHQFNGQTLWRPFEDVFNITKLRKHARIELVSDPSKYVKELTPGSSVMYLRDEIMADVCGEGLF